MGTVTAFVGCVADLAGGAVYDAGRCHRRHMRSRHRPERRRGGRTADSALTRLVDVFLAMPGLVLALAVIAALGPEIAALGLTVSVSFSANLARLARSYAISAR